MKGNIVMKEFRPKETVGELIHKELFRTTTEYQYYNFGVAQGLHCIYEMAKGFKENKFNGEELMQVIKHAVEHSEKDIIEYFNKLTKIEEEKAIEI
jgi:hypothetical protein